MSPRIVPESSIGWVEPVAADARVAELAQVLTMLSSWDDPSRAVDADVTDADRVDRIAVLECGNHVREIPGWPEQQPRCPVKVVHDGLSDRPDTIQVTTPTGHTYLSQAPQPP